MIKIISPTTEAYFRSALDPDPKRIFQTTSPVARSDEFKKHLSKNVYHSSFITL